MGYDHGDRFPFNFEPNGILFDIVIRQLLLSGTRPIYKFCNGKLFILFLSSLNTLVEWDMIVVTVFRLILNH